MFIKKINTQTLQKLYQSESVIKVIGQLLKIELLLLYWSTGLNQIKWIAIESKYK